MRTFYFSKPRPEPKPIITHSVLYEPREVRELRFSHPLYDIAWQVWLTSGKGKLEAHGVGFGRNITTARIKAMQELKEDQERLAAGKKKRPRWRTVTGRPGR